MERLDQAVDKGLLMQTMASSDIPNYQVKEISQFERNQFGAYERKFGTGVEIRSEATPLYNCHGLTFGSRRTGIYDPSVVELILKDDAYVDVPEDRVLPGDIILYIGEDGDIEHSGIVVTTPSKDLLRIPMVVSKWGKYREILHLANKCDYNFSNVRYCRMKL